MKKKELKALQLNKKSISNLKHVSGGNPFRLSLLYPNDPICPIQLTGPCDTTFTEIMC
jgi:hypothetical protein